PETNVTEGTIGRAVIFRSFTPNRPKVWPCLRVWTWRGLLRSPRRRSEPAKRPSTMPVWASTPHLQNLGYRWRARKIFYKFTVQAVFQQRIKLAENCAKVENWPIFWKPPFFLRWPQKSAGPVRACQCWMHPVEQVAGAVASFTCPRVSMACLAFRIVYCLNREARCS
ncbi:unnamed protein product, partial [Nesidiocoris tenuis]